MIKNVLKRRKEGGTYEVTGSRHQLKAAVPAESDMLSIIFHRHLYSPAMSTASNLVGAALFPSF
jgi:hypothetical protein